MAKRPLPGTVAHRAHNGGIHPIVPEKPFFRAEIKPDGVLELLVYEQIGENFDWWSGESTGISAKSVKAQLDSADYSSILMRINSPGGDAFEGIAILNVLRSQSKPVNVMVDGIAASAASIIAMAGTTIEMGSGAMMMIHNAWGFCMGNAQDMTQQANALGAIDKSIAQTYVDRTGLKVDEVQAMMDAETWLSADECIEQGFATGKQKASAQNSRKALAMAKTFKAMSRFQHVPANLRLKGAAAAAAADPEPEQECACDCNACVAGNCEDCTNEICMDPNCADCPMQAGDELPFDSRARIDVMAAALRTSPRAEISVVGEKRILALRTIGPGSAALNLVPVDGTTVPVARVCGLLAPYNQPSTDLGGFKEVYAPGCFTESIANDDSLILTSHNIDHVIGRKSAGTARFFDQEDGLHYEADLPNTHWANDLRVSLERGDVTESSAAFFIDEYRWEQRDGFRVRVIEKARLVEGGPHPLGAYGQTSAAVVIQSRRPPVMQTQSATFTGLTGSSSTGFTTTITVPASGGSNGQCGGIANIWPVLGPAIEMPVINAEQSAAAEKAAADEAARAAEQKELEQYESRLRLLKIA